MAPASEPHSTRRQLARASLLAVVVISFVGSGLARQWLTASRAEQGASTGARTKDARRIVSLAPSVTETLFAVGCGDRLVGATRYCDFPPAARRIPRVGGYMDPSFERIAERKPDLVVALDGPVHKRVRAYLRRMGMPLLTVDHESLAGIVSSMDRLAAACGRPRKGASLAAVARQRLARVAARVRGLPRPRVLIVFGRATLTGPIREVYVAGRKGLYDDVLQRAGGRNAFPRDVPAYPKLSAEGITSLDPDIILELAPELGRKGASHEQLMASWRTMPSLRAVRTDAVHILPGSYGEVPGPRFVDLVEHLAALLHPPVPGLNP